MEKKKSNSQKGNTRYMPEGAKTITPYLVLDDAAKFLDFAKKAFDAKVESITKDDNDEIANANVIIGDSAIMVSDKMERMNVETAMLYLYVKDVDAVHKKALDAGASVLQKVQDQFYGDRAGAVKDQWGNKWWIATHIEDLSPMELEKRAKQANQDMKKSELETADA